MSPDPFIQAPDNSQNYNRYAYCLNNPLLYTDPSGNEVLTLAIVAIYALKAAIIGGLVYTGMAFYTGEFSWGGLAKSIIVGAISGAATFGAGQVAQSIQLGSKFWTGVVQQVVQGAVASIVPSPSISIPVGDWSFSISASIAGGNSTGIGFNFSIGYNDGNFSASFGFGLSNFSNYNGTGVSGLEIRNSLMMGYKGKDFGFSIGTNFWSGAGGMKEFTQRTGALGLSSGDFGVNYENDGKPFSGWVGDGNDSYRTAAASISIGKFSMNLNLFTGKRTEEDYKIEKAMPGGEVGYSSYGKYGEYYKNGIVHERGTKYRLGVLSFGYNGYNIGLNSEWIRHQTQNKMIHGSKIANQRMFEMTSDKWNSYFQYKTKNQFTSW